MIAALPRLHAVTDDHVIAQGGVVARAGAMAAAAGASLAVHLRGRTLEGRECLALARELQQVLAPHGTWLIVNGRADVARAAQARAVVSGRGGLAAADIRRVAPQALVIRSVHDAHDVKRATGEHADALMAGTGAGDHAAEPGLVRLAASTGPRVIAIGGVTPANTPEWLAAGAWGVAAIRALWDAADPGAAARDFLAQLPADERVSLVINGAPRTAHGGTLADLLAELGLDARAVVVEHNRKIVRRDGLAGTPLTSGDTIELVHFVGGG